MDRDHDVTTREVVGPCNRFVIDFGHLLHLEVVVAAAERAHLIALALLRRLGDAVGASPRHRAAFLDALQVLGCSPASSPGPARAFAQHCVDLALAEGDGPRASDAGRNAGKERIGETRVLGLDIAARETRVQAAHPAGDVESDAARRDDAALLGIERRDPADRKSVSPVRIGHRE